MKKQKFHTLQEVAKLLRVSERSMYRYIKTGKLKAIKVGYWKITEQDFKRFLANNSNVNK